MEARQGLKGDYVLLGGEGGFVVRLYGVVAYETKQLQDKEELCGNDVLNCLACAGR